MLTRFVNDRKAGVAPFLALAALPLMAATGAAVDFSRASSARASMQAAVDSTALMVAKNAGTLTGAQMQSQATGYFNAVFTRTDVDNAAVTVSYTAQGGNALVVAGSGSISTKFMNIAGYSSIPIGAKSTVKWSNQRLRVALVLDNTGSMSQSGKMTALKTASQNLLTQLKNAATQDGDVYVSIVTFAKDVNVGTANVNAPWIDWEYWDAANGTCSNSYYYSKSSCTSAGKIWTPASHSTWNGCVMDRDQNFDTTNTAPVAGSTLFPAEQYSSCPAAMMGLSYDWTALNNKISAMQPSGATNQAIGLQWGFQTLTASPFTIPPMDPNYQYQQIIILLTDGLNTQDRWYGNGSSPSSQVDARQQITCNNIKAAGITMYTVQVNTGGDPTSALLQSCASSADKFFLLTTADQIVTTFNTIGTSLTKLHIAQ
jgi:Flp pilus assembly protein TadG